MTSVAISVPSYALVLENDSSINIILSFVIALNISEIDLHSFSSRPPTFICAFPIK